MASNTPNLGLLKKDPVADGNETFNIKTMLNDNWDKIDEAVGNIKVPDASLTEKGIVQLSNATDGTREDVAATEKAVKAAYDRGSAGISAAAAAQAKADAAETPAGAQIKANTAEANAKSYADSGFYNKSTMDTVNLVKNCTALFGLSYWNTVFNWGYTNGPSVDVGGYFYPTQNADSGTSVWMDSNGIWVVPNTVYTYGCTFHTNASTNGVRIEIIGYANGGVSKGIISTLWADANKWWHRKTTTVMIPTDVVQIAIRLVVDGPMTNPTSIVRGFSRIKFTVGSADKLTHEGDLTALFQYANDGKSRIASAINGKGVPASGSDNFATLADKINQIPLGMKLYSGVIPDFIVDSGKGSVKGGEIRGIPFTPKIIIISRSNSSSYSYDCVTIAFRGLTELRNGTAWYENPQGALESVYLKSEADFLPDGFAYWATSAAAQPGERIRYYTDIKYLVLG